MANGSLVSNATPVTATAGVNDIAVPDYNTANVASVAVFIDTWWINNSWTAPIAGTWFSDCTATQQNGPNVPCDVTPQQLSVGPVETYVRNGVTKQYQVVQFSVTAPTAGSQVVDFTATVDVSKIPGLLLPPTQTRLTYSSVSLVSPPACSNYPVMRVKSAGYQLNQTWYLGQAPPERPLLCG